MIEIALAAVDADSAGHWPTVAGVLADAYRAANARIAELEVRNAKKLETIKSLRRKSARQGQHARNLETKLARLKAEGGKYVAALADATSRIKETNGILASVSIIEIMLAGKPEHATRISRARVLNYGALRIMESLPPAPDGKGGEG